MKRKLFRLSMVLVTSALLSSCSGTRNNLQALFEQMLTGWNALTEMRNDVFSVASQVESITDKLYTSSAAVFGQNSQSKESDEQSCEIRNTAVITIYSINGMAQNAIDVKLDGMPVGSLSTYFPDDAPTCKTPTARGVITLKVSKGKHTIKATSPNLDWPERSFSVDKCSCMLLPLS